MEDCNAQKAKELLGSDWEVRNYNRKYYVDGKTHLYLTIFLLDVWLLLLVGTYVSWCLTVLCLTYTMTACRCLNRVTLISHANVGSIRTVEIMFINNIQLSLHKKLVTGVKTRISVDQIRNEVVISTFSDGAESMSKVHKAVLNDVDAIASGSVNTSKDYEKNGETSMNNSVPAYTNDNLGETGFSASGYEEKNINLVRKRKNDGETTPTKRTKLNDNISMDSDFTFFSVESINYDRGLGNYEEGTEINLDLSFQETDEDLTIPSSERLFNENIWRQWRLGSGKVVTDLLAKFANKTGHPFRIAKPEWYNADQYSEIQKYVRRATISSCPESISKLLKLREMEKIQVLINTNEINNENSKKILQEELKINYTLSSLQDPFTNFFIKILAILGRKSCSCRERRRCTTLFEQKTDGVFVIRLKKSSVEVRYLEMSGGHGHKDFSRSTWDSCYKLPIGNTYMLEEIGEKFRGAFCETFSKISVFSLHTYENQIELWRMYVPSCGVLQYERTHRTTVPICFEEERKCIFNFVVALWDLRCWLLEVFELIYKLLEEHNDSDVNESNLHSGILPPHPFTLQKDKHKKAEKAELEAKNAELLKQVTEESTKREAENVELKARIAKLEQIAEENTELKDRITKLEQKQIQDITNEQEASPTKDISPLTESHSYEEKGIISDLLPEIEYSSTQPESSMEPETSITSLPQDIIHDDSAEILDFVGTIHKERISSEIRERNREKKFQESHNNLIPPIQSETSTMSTPESLDSKTVKKLRDQNKSQNETS
ncbi:hypothetical protein Glove_212g87 [Diversispora epigaea]|uniref:Uncharacterized protein n=1 Tax=Diversispora epigaea TaxID=1348612 RepID=A0A397IL58_9GLOM|nr:hypothetical protein Glove_212g87 [Diversispora epigaea]